MLDSCYSEKWCSQAENSDLVSIYGLKWVRIYSSTDSVSHSRWYEYNKGSETQDYKDAYGGAMWSSKDNQILEYKSKE